MSPPWAARTARVHRVLTAYSQIVRTEMVTVLLIRRQARICHVTKRQRPGFVERVLQRDNITAFMDRVRYPGNKTLPSRGHP